MLLIFNNLCIILLIEFLGDELLTNRIRLTAVAVILLILITSFVSLDIVSRIDIRPVKNVHMTESTADTITLKWQRVKHADGYKVYKISGDNEPELVATVEDKSASQCTVEKMGSASQYTLDVTAFRYFNSKTYEGKPSQPVEAYTLPETLDAVASPHKANALTVSWTEQENATAYEIEYSKNEDLSDAGRVTVKDDNEWELGNLKIGDVYYARGRSYYELNGERIYGAWSEITSAKIKEKVVMSTSIDPDKPMIALTYLCGAAYSDEGGKSTEIILDTLEEYNARGTFFMVASRIADENSPFLQREYDMGCELGNHTYDHRHYGSDVTASDISEASSTIYDWSGHYPTLFRSPGGILTDTILYECEEEGMPLAYWSVDTEDWKSKDTKKVYEAIIDGAYDGAIILMHDIYPTTAQAVQRAVPKLIEDGYQLVTVSELIYYKSGYEAEAGVQYRDGYETT